MKHLTGKKVTVYCQSGKGFTGVVTAGSDDVLKILPEGKTDELVIFAKNIFAYTIIGEGTTGGYSGLKVYVCKCDSINCKGRVKVSYNDTTINDMGCKVCTAKTVAGTGFKCDFGCIGALEVIPSNVQKILLNNMIVARNEKKNDKFRKTGTTESQNQ